MQLLSHQRDDGSAPFSSSLVVVAASCFVARLPARKPGTGGGRQTGTVRVCTSTRCGAGGPTCPKQGAKKRLNSKLTIISDASAAVKDDQPMATAENDGPTNQNIDVQPASKSFCLEMLKREVCTYGDQNIVFLTK